MVNIRLVMLLVFFIFILYKQSSIYGKINLMEMEMEKLDRTERKKKQLTGMFAYTYGHNETDGGVN